MALVSAETYPWYRVRATQYDAIYVSPHMDDAVYSCGGQIALTRAHGARILILTLFGNGRDDERGHGVFGDLQQRKREERAAADLLDVDHLWLNLPDFLFRKKSLPAWVHYSLPFLRLPTNPLQQRIRASVTAVAQRLLAPDGRLYFPLAIGSHPDHREVHEAGRAIHDEWAERVVFYEDVPYTQVPALRDDRLRELGFATDAALATSAREVHDFVFAHTPRWLRPLTRGLVFGQRIALRTLFRGLGCRDRIAHALRLEEIDISSVIERKVEAMRLYATQTDHLFPRGDAFYAALSRSGGRFVERYWTLAKWEGGQTGTPGDPVMLAAEQRRVDALVRAQGASIH